MYLVTTSCSSAEEMVTASRPVLVQGQELSQAVKPSDEINPRLKKT